jgi:serine/threonine-protein kinase
VTGPGNIPPTAAERLRRAEKVYFEVAAMLPHERDAAVAKACADDPALASDVHALLRAGDQIGGFLERPALGGQIGKLAEVAGFTDELLGQGVGPYRIERRIASGGMGTVYLAVRADGQFTQQVAVKVVKRGMDSEEVLRRFAAERQTLAALDHPNVARLFDAGLTSDQRPYLVMEYVDGVPIDEYCDSKRLSVKERLRLFRTVCDAVHAAHAALIIHRDLKPTNILVTREGVPKLLDFGIAKLLTDAPGMNQTLEADRRLTPEYASPEQVSGEHVTTASDVYSLGVVLYELLTGLRPYRFATRSTDEVKRVVCVEVPPVPSQAVTVRITRLGTGTKPGAPTGTPAAPPAPPDAPKTRGVSSTRLRGLLRGDLDTIIMTALRKEPDRRYASAEQFSADIGRFLAGMPVTARKDTLSYRAAKFVRRHAVGTALSAVAVLAVSASAVVLYVQRGELRERNAALVVANQRVEQARDFLEGVIGGADIARRGPSAPLSEVLDAAQRRMQEDTTTDPAVRASITRSLGRAQMSLGQTGAARVNLQAALDLTRANTSDDADAIIDAEVDLAVLQHAEGESAQAEAALRELLARVRARSAGAPTEREAALLNNIGATIRQKERAGEALALQREALTLRQRLGPGNELKVAESHNSIGTALFGSATPEGYAAAVPEFERALAMRRTALRANHPTVVRTQRNLGLALVRAGDNARALPMLKEAAEAWTKAFGDDHPAVVSAWTSYAEALRTAGNHDEALAWLRKSLAWQQAHTPTDSVNIAATEANIGATLAAQGKDAEALPLLERTLPIVEAAKYNAVTKLAKGALADMYDRAGRAEDAAKLRTPPGK